MDPMRAARPERPETLRGYAPSVRDTLSSEAFERLDNILRLAPSASQAPEPKAGIEERSIHHAVDVVQKASKALEQMEARLIDMEARTMAVSARAAEEIRILDGRLKVSEQRGRELAEKADQAERRVREAEAKAEARLRIAEQRAKDAEARAETAEREGQQAQVWLRRLHDSITESFRGTLSTSDWLRRLDDRTSERPAPAVG